MDPDPRTEDRIGVAGTLLVLASVMVAITLVWGGWVGALGLALIAVTWGVSTYSLLVIFLVWVPLQNFVLPLLYAQGNLPADTVRLLIPTKEAILILGLTLALIRQLRTGFPQSLLWVDWLAVVYLVWVTVYLPIPNQWVSGSSATDLPLAAKLISYRMLVVPPTVYLWGRFAAVSNRFRANTLRLILWFHVGIAAFGLVERFFLPLDFWRHTVGMGAYLLDVKGLLPGYNVDDGLTVNMFTVGIRRLVSVYADPLSAGSAGVFPLILGVTLWMQRGQDLVRSRGAVKLAIVVLGTALLLTITREAILAAFIAIVLLLARRRNFLALGTLVVSSLSVGLLVSEVASVARATVSLTDTSASWHWRFLSQGIAQLPHYLLGYGLGSTGTWAYALFDIKQEGIGENAYLTLTGQAGVFAAILLLAFLIGVARSTYRALPACRDETGQAFLLAVGATMIGRILMGNVSDNLFAFTAMAEFYLLAGMAVAQSARILSSAGIPADLQHSLTPMDTRA